MKKITLIAIVMLCAFLIPKNSSGQTTITNWYNEWNDAFDSTNYLSYYFLTYPDSNILVPASWGGTAYNVSTQGLGFSFDPTDHSYSYNTINPVLPAMMDTGQSFTLDSFMFYYNYLRNNPSTTVVDSVIIEFTRTAAIPSPPDSGVYKLIFSAGPPIYYSWTTDPYTGFPADGTPRYATAIVDNNVLKNDILDSCKMVSPGSKMRFAIPLTNSSPHITSATGVFTTSDSMKLSLGAGIYCKYPEKLVAYVYFKSGVSYPLNTSVTVANTLMLYAGNPTSSSGVPFGQTPSNSSTGYPGSFNTGLINNNITRYGLGGGYTFGSHEILIPENAYSADAGFDVPNYGFHIKYVTPVAPISGPSGVCYGSTIALTDPTPGGTWSSGNPSYATVGSSTGIVTGVSSSYGIVNITYTTLAGYTVKTIYEYPAPNPIFGSTSVCAGSTITLSDFSFSSYGIWSSSPLTVATVGSSSGIVTGISGGVATITYSLPYTITTTCHVTQPVTVIPIPSTGTISGPSTTCIGGTITLTDGMAGGTWHSSGTGIATVGSSSGIVTGVSLGTVTISYTITNTCGTSTSVKLVTVNTVPSAGIISGASSVCVGSTITLADGAPGGVWTSTGTSIATIGSSTGVVTGVSAGTTGISYTVTTACGTATALTAITVNPLPSAGTISGLSTVCELASITLSDGITGGVWSSTNSTIATVVSSTGIVTGVTAGTDSIIYTVTGICFSVAAVQPITVNPLPVAGAITGLHTMCADSAITLTDTLSGGTWSSVTSGIATVGTSGMVSGVSAGTDSIIYTVTNICGSAAASFLITVNPLPNAGTVTGASSVCTGSSITLTDSVSGGLWTATNGDGFISTSGVVLGVTTGTDTFKYSYTNVCGTAVSSKVITIIALPDPGVISGPDTVCFSAPITMIDTVSAGTWSLTNVNATIGTSGTVNGVTVGIDTVVYSVTNTCGTNTAQKLLIVSECISEVKGMPASGSAINIFPNPTQSSITVISSEPISSIVITNTLGQKVFSRAYNDKKIIINMQDLPVGVYYLKINDNNYKVIKE